MRIALLLYPLLELWSLIELGAQTSGGIAVLWVLGAGFLGMATIRFAGTQVLSRLQAAQRKGALQQQLVAGDLSLAMAGLLLIIPGLLSDALAVLVLIRPFRRLFGFLLTAGWSHGDMSSASDHSHRNTYQHTNQDIFRTGRAQDDEGGQGDGVILEGEFQELDAEAQQLPHQEFDNPDS